LKAKPKPREAQRVAWSCPACLKHDTVTIPAAATLKEGIEILLAKTLEQHGKCCPPENIRLHVRVNKKNDRIEST